MVSFLFSCVDFYDQKQNSSLLLHYTQRTIIFNMKKFLMTLIIGIIVIPKIVLASWWNPFSWFQQEVRPGAPIPQKQQNLKSETIKRGTSISLPEEFSPVLNVVDGDTLNVSLSGKKTTLRLIGINTPEAVDPRRPVECFGKESSVKAKEILSRKKVRIETDASQGTLDKYGRTLAYVFLEDGTNFNEYMIKEGYAYEYTYTAPYKYQKEFKVAQSEAQKLKRGLWAPEICEFKNTTTPS